jgi:AcrR family transcriptional regulator
MNKSEQTRGKILKAGMFYIARFGLSSVTIGEIAKAAGMSRTGVISHFNNKEAMQVAIMSYAQEQFVNKVLKQAYCENPLENLINLKFFWLNWMNQYEENEHFGCPFIKAAVEYKEREGSVIQIHMQDQQQRLLDYLIKLVERCVLAGLLKKEINAQLFCYEYYSLYLGYCIQQNFGNPALADTHFYQMIDALIERYRP